MIANLSPEIVHPNDLWVDAQKEQPVEAENALSQTSLAAAAAEKLAQAQARTPAAVQSASESAAEASAELEAIAADRAGRQRSFQARQVLRN